MESMITSQDKAHARQYYIDRLNIFLIERGYGSSENYTQDEIQNILTIEGYIGDDEQEDIVNDLTRNINKLNVNVVDINDKIDFFFFVFNRSFVLIFISTALTIMFQPLGRLSWAVCGVLFVCNLIAYAISRRK